MPFAPAIVEFNIAQLNVLDLVVLLMLVLFFISGVRKGLAVTLGSVAGFVAGGIAAFFAIPLVSSWVSDPAWRLFAVIAAAVILIVTGQAIGSAIGRRIRLWLNFPALKGMDRLFGGIANTAVAALVISAIAFSVSSMGIGLASQLISSSKVISGIRNVTPVPVSRALAEARALVMGQTIPELLEPFAPVSTPPATDSLPESEQLALAAESVVRIKGTAIACGVNQTGSGFVAADNRIITNAHVVSGISEPVVETLDGVALPADVVYFDAEKDLAVLAVEDLSEEPLDVGDPLDTGDQAVFMGYPAGGPFAAEPATVQSMRNVSVQNIYGSDPALMQVYQLAANVQQGNSGGPLLTEDGDLIGVIFARAKDGLSVGYAIGMDEVQPVINAAPSLSEPVSTGACTTN